MYLLEIPLYNHTTVHVVQLTGFCLLWKDFIHHSHQILIIMNGKTKTKSYDKKVAIKRNISTSPKSFSEYYFQC